MFKKNDIAAMITTTVTHYGFGSGKAPTKHHTIDIVRVASASRDGFVKSYRTHNASPIYKHYDRTGRIKFMTISGDMQACAARLFDKAASPETLRFYEQEAAKAAISAACPV